MARPPSPLMRFNSRLCAGLPGMNEGPLVPPLTAVARETRESFAWGADPLWQGRHFAESMGCTSVAKSTAPSGKVAEMQARIQYRVMYP